MLRLHATHDVALLQTKCPWAFRPGDFVSREGSSFQITRVARDGWFWLRRQSDLFVVYGTPVAVEARTD
jgi:hypothetical protein